ncbi:MAG: hypothetical protein FWC93_02725 [Defluviitaleaceae bacterium]|nr:hypothetical protein [Defluviitaleaceae bacterium]
MGAVKSYWGYTGKIFMMLALIFPAFLLFARLIDGPAMAGDPRVYALYLLGIGYFTIGFVLFVAGKYGDRKLKRLKKTGKALKPIETTALPSFISPLAFEGTTYNSFHIKCVLRNARGAETVVKSRRLTVCEGHFFIIPQPAQILCDAVVYVNPRKPYDFAIEVWIC